MINDSDLLQKNLKDSSDIQHLLSKDNLIFLSNSELCNNLQKITTEKKKLIISDADRISNHEINLLGLNLNLGSTINWLKDYKTSRTWPLDHFTKIQISYDDKSDIKNVWELSRFYHIPTLISAFLLTKNNKYLNEIINRINTLIDGNPTYFDANWACPMEAAIRLSNWLFVWVYLKKYINDETFKTKLLISFYNHGNYIFNNLEYGYFKSNHYLSDIVGLIFLGVVFSEFKTSKKWLRFSLKSLENEMKKQVSNEGVNFEASTSYHRLTLELFLYSAILCKKNNITLSQKYHKKLEKMIEFIFYETKNNGEIPQFGDNDNGRLFIFSNYYRWNVLDHRYLLQIGSIFFKRDDFLNLNTNNLMIDNSFIFPIANENDNSQTCKNKNLTPTKKLYKKSGYFFHRTNNSYFALTFTGNGGRHEMGGHGHNDFGSFELQSNGEDFIIDPGTGSYTGNQRLRNHLRSQKQHNSLTINNLEFNDFNNQDLFHYQEFFKPKLISSETKSGSYVIKIFNTAYKKKLNIIYYRIFNVNFNRGEIIIEDRLENLDPKKRYNLFFNFNLAPECKIISINKNIITTDKGIFEFNKELSLEVKKGVYSPAYGITNQIDRVVAQKSISNLTSITYVTLIHL